MIKACFIARTSDAFLLCEYNDSMVANYADLRTKSKKLIQSERTREGDVEFVGVDNQSYVK